jgi:hypothetical protein
MNRKIIRKITIRLLKESIVSLYIQDKRNIDMRVNEMNICSRLGHYLENRLREYGLLFDGYYVDTEYNRGVYGHKTKYVEYNDGKLHSVRCDLLIHSRGLKTPDNILALEMKKENVDTNVDSDHDRLENIVKPRTQNTQKEAVCDTILGVFLEIGSSTCKLTYYWYDAKLFSSIEEIKIEDAIKPNSIE